MFVLIGIALILLGFMLMAGGASNDPTNYYPEAEIYGFRRTVLAVVVILLGFVMQIVAIFIKDEPNVSSPTNSSKAEAIINAGKNKTTVSKGNNSSGKKSRKQNR